MVLDRVRLAQRRILEDHRAAQLGVSAGTVRLASRTAVSKSLEQSPLSAVKRYGLLAREEAGLK